MKFSIEVNKCPNTKSLYIAVINPMLYDAGKVGAPACIRYGYTKDEAYGKLKDRLIYKGHTVIE